VWELIRLANRHPRVNILQPGPGVGGHCIAVDPWFIVSQVPEEARIIRAAREINDSKPQWVMSKVHHAVAEYAAETGKSAHIACFGLAFKPNIDDLRESPALRIVSELARFYPGQVDVVEPYISVLPDCLIDKVELTPPSEAVKRSDIIVLLVDHDDFKVMPAPHRIDRRMIDTRGVWS
jgi:UDP-N-acetyl-D-mannosaminuronic acid dehydrogenase